MDGWFDCEWMNGWMDGWMDDTLSYRPIVDQLSISFPIVAVHW
jgi:hypothetical protein